MSDLESILNTMKLPIVIWKKNDDKIVCSYTNNMATSIKKDMQLDTYLTDNNTYENILKMQNNDEITINDTGNTIIFTKLNDNTFYEIHYMKCQNINILYSISNKIRNPLTNIMGMLIMLEETEMTNDQLKYLGIIKKSSYDIITVVNDIIDIINLDKNNIKLEIESVSLKNLIETVIEIVTPDIKKKKLQLNYQIDSNLPDVIEVDKPRLEQIIINILRNAIKFTKYGIINLTVTFFSEINNTNCPFPYVSPKDDEYNILFKVKDTGTGMDYDQKIIIDKVLGIDEFKKTKPYKNYGFGLLISNYLCRLMNGRIWYKSEYDIGSIFYFNIVCKGIMIKKDDSDINDVD